MEGLPLLLGVDTGANRTVLTPRGARKLHASAAGTKTVRQWSAGGWQSGEVGLVKDATIVLPQACAAYFSSLEVVESSGGSDATPIDGVLGNDVLSQGVLHIDYAAGRMELTAR